MQHTTAAWNSTPTDKNRLSVLLQSFGCADVVAPVDADAFASRLLKKFVGELIFAMFPSQAEASRRDDLRYRLRIRYLFASSWLLQTDSSRCGQYLWDANEIVGGRGEDEEPFDQRPSAVPGFAQAADSLHPTERFLDPFSLDRAETITGMPGR